MKLKFPIPPAHEEECLDIFLSRLAKECGYQSKVWLLNLINLPYYTDPNKIASEKTLSQLSDLCTVEKHRLLRMTIHKFIPTFLHPDEIDYLIISNWNTYNFPIWDSATVKNFYTRKACNLCPHCYNQFRTGLLPWKFASVTTCEVHKCILIDRCPKCGSKELNIVEGICDVCEMPIDEMTTDDISQSSSSMSLSHWVHAMFGLQENFPFSQNFDQRKIQVSVQLV